MNDEWVETTLGEVADFTNGYPFKPADLHGTTLPVIRIRQLLDAEAETDFTDVEVPARNLIHNGDLIFSWSGTLASRFWNRGPAALNQHLFRVTAKSGSDLGWVHLALDHAIEELSTKTHGTTMKHVTKKVLESHGVIRPPLFVQRRIVDLMTHLDSHLANLRTERDTLLRAISAGCRSLTDPEQCAESVGIADVVDVLDKSRVPISETERLTRPGNVPYFGANGQVGWIDAAIFDEPLVLLAEDGGPIAEWASRPQAYEITGPAWVNNHAHVLRATGVSHDWLLYSLRHRDLTAFASIGTRAKLTQGSLREIRIGLPVDMETRGAALRALDVTAQSLSAEVAALESVRGSLLSGLLAGLIELPEAYDELISRVV